ncbi:hypothetical protein DS742_07400 [Lacrimispora amygdalina]|uniref:Uncharacterized protein n=1 Tax=Lacrimispora amygdalina TaxID=253257 RepID=A0A3E2NFD0_9FIRM|nr:hypothetical protein [Clostridium indicum]RFZ79591.1 hypothetical protein DS742_07400 [Clostridium indicum]
MEYMDEKIINLRNQAKKAEHTSLEKGVYIKEGLLSFERRKLFDGEMSILLPVPFKIMPEEIAKIKYPSEQRPQLIYSNAGGDVNFTFSLFDEQVNTSQIKEARDRFRGLIKKIQPANLFIEKKEEDLKDTVAAWFDFKNYGLDAQLYNLFYFTNIKGKLLHGIFNCKFEEAEAWKPIAVQVIKSVFTDERDSN